MTTNDVTVEMVQQYLTATEAVIAAMSFKPDSLEKRQYMEDLEVMRSMLLASLRGLERIQNEPDQSATTQH